MLPCSGLVYVCLQTRVYYKLDRKDSKDELLFLFLAATILI